MPQIFLTGWTCINSDASTSVCTTSVANTATSSEFIAYHDWLFVNVCVLFCLGFVVWGIAFSVFNQKRR